MRTLGKIIITISFFIVYTGFGQTTDLSSEPFYDLKDDSWVAETFNKLSPRERIAQLFFIDAYSNRDKKYVDSLMTVVKEQKIGGLIFFQGSPLKQAQLTNLMQANSKVPLLVHMDAEWGLAMRLDSVMPFPYQMTLGAIANNDLILEMGKAIGEQLNRQGVHINYAPVADVNNNPNNPVINFRSFGSNKYNVAAKSLAYTKGLQIQNVLASGKHFPGHGDTDVDSHLALPVILHDKERIDSLELFPFKHLIKNGLGGMMVAHLNVPSLQKNKALPSTLSKSIVTNLLIDSLGFKGLIMTDALNMKGVTKSHAPGEVEVKAFLAGNEALLYSENIGLGIQKIQEAVKSGLILQKEIDNRCLKILKLKRWAGLDKRNAIGTENLIADLNKDEYLTAIKNLYQSALTLLQNKNNIIPLEKTNTLKLAALSIGIDTITSFQNTLSEYVKLDHFNTSLEPTDIEINALLETVLKYDKVIVGIHSPSMYSYEDYGVSQQMIKLVDKLSHSGKSIVVSFSNPYALNLFKGINKSEAILLTYQNNELTEEIAARAIFGEVQSRGSLPVDLNEFSESTNQYRENPTSSKDSENLKTNLSKDLEQDSLKHTMNTTWDVEKKIHPGVVLKKNINKKLFGRIQTFSVVEIDLSSTALVKTVSYSPKRLIKPSKLAKKVNGIVAINGNFFNPQGGGSVCYLKQNDKIINQSKPDPEELLFLPMLDEGAIAIDNSGTIDIIEKPKKDWNHMKTFPTVLSSGPLLVFNDNILDQESIPFIEDEHARTAVGISKDKLYLVVVDGYRKEATGMSINELAKLMHTLGSYEAINLDGGGSSTLWIKDQKGSGIINYPSDNKKFDHKGERKVANALVITIN